MKRDSDGQRIALFVDFENLVTRTGLSAEQFDIGPALDTLLDKGKVLFRRSYCDWTRFAPATRNLHEHGVELIDVPPSTRAGKNGADVRLVIDALELAYLRPASQRRARGEGAGSREKEKERAPAKPAVVPEIAREAVSALLSRATGPVNPSAVKEFIVRKEPDFDEHEHGFSTFKKLLEAMEKEGLLKREQGAKGQWYVVAP